MTLDPKKYLDCQEYWKDVPGYEGSYQVSSLGRVKSKYKILKPYREKSGYLQVTISLNGKTKKVRIHRLVLLAFKGRPGSGMEACHNDGDKANNKLSNLRWDTHSANQLDKRKHGVAMGAIGTRCHTAKLDEALVNLIRASPGTTREIGLMFGVHSSTISLIKQGKIWSHCLPKS